MKRDGAKLANDTIRTFHYNTRSSSKLNGSRAISDTDRVETSDAIVDSTSPPASLRVTRRRKKISDDRRASSVVLPIDTIIEVFKRLPVKTLARFLCLSKLWASIIRSPNFKKLFLAVVAESSNRPGSLLFYFPYSEGNFLLSSLQTQDPGEASVATYHMPNPAYKRTTNLTSVHGLICYETACGSGLAVYNSSTRRSITLPKFEPGNFLIQHYLGYDPIDHVFKVLCITGPMTASKIQLEMAQSKLVAQVLTLGSETSWKMIEVSHTHFPYSSQICVNGVVYYVARAGAECKEVAYMSFDVRSEKFDLIERPSDSVVQGSTLFRYEGKLAIVSREVPADGSIAMWVLEDAVKHEWSKKVFVLPNSWRRLARGKRTSLHTFHRFVSVTDAGELILAPTILCVPRPIYYVLYCDPERNRVRKVEIGGITEHNLKLLRCKKRNFCSVIPIFSSQGESLMFL
ncbi:unnamed protein product [Microthlaspi erraticum]|uniref:F-box domain-containing protein n=1 Tax=Microthlaspi erraticum TaxID=1685480 RepID=A0A6D2JX51_9BRAS|nr:unnamed protein product [Microthlaspi erraticum]CAA7044839.1 unnamed protein product [Microthlaspi erraticum]